MRPPKFLKKYFWDIDVKRSDGKLRSPDTLLRLLEYGDEKAMGWVKKNFTKRQITDVLYRLRNISPKSANFWALGFGINRKKILCLQKPYLKIRKKHWPY